MPCRNLIPGNMPDLKIDVALASEESEPYASPPRQGLSEPMIPLSRPGYSTDLNQGRIVHNRDNYGFT
jgi:hypothetical protein